MSTMPGDALGDLNDVRFFVAVVDHGGFSAAGRALRVPKSRLSQRVAHLEERLGVRLVQRTTRRFVVTEVGERFLAHARAMLEQARAAQDAVAELRAEPSGIVRMSCPVALVQTVLAGLLPEFLAAHPKVQVRLVASNRRVDLIGEGIDIAMRVRSVLDADATLVMRTVGVSRALIVAAPSLLDVHGRATTPCELAALPFLSMLEHDGAQVLRVLDGEGRAQDVEMQARLVCGDFLVLLEAAKQGLGVTTLPEFVCAGALARGELEVVLPDWSVPQGTVHFVYATRRGLLPGVRALVDFLAERLPGTMRENHAQCVTKL